jgi:RNA recognition motif-containing protein
MTTPAQENKAAIYVGDLPNTAILPDLNRMFEKFGKIINIRMLKDKNTSSDRKPAAIIQFDSEESADRAVDEMKFGMYNDTQIRTMKYNKNFINVACNIFVKHLNPTVDSQQLNDYFKQFGEVKSAKICTAIKEG